MNINLKGRKAIIGGGSRGIGRACANELALLGADVILLSRTADLLRQACESLPADEGQSHRFLQVDFDEPAATLDKVRDLVADVGTVHVLVNNSGGPAGGSIAEATIEQFDAGLRGHLFTSHLLTQLVLPGMRAAGFGRIINIISVSVRQPLSGLGVSNTVRAAMAAWAKTLSAEVAGDGITVNSILPGYTNTDRLTSLMATRATSAGITIEQQRQHLLDPVPMGRFADPSEIASAAAFLATPAASYITGVCLPVDGGFLDAI